MPVYSQTYRQYEGTVRRRFRWLIVIEQEFRVLSQFKVFKFLVFVALLHVLFRLLQVVSYDVIMQDPNNPLNPLLSRVQYLTVNAQTFFDFIRLQAPLVFIIGLYAGAGMICNDLRNNLMPVYFSKPIRWSDYALGKSLALILLGLSLTALPVIILLVLHNLLLPRWDVFENSLWWGMGGIAFSLTIVLPCMLGILASSALMRGQGYAAITVFMILIADSVMSVLLAELLRDRNYLIISFPMALNRLGQHYFDTGQLLFNLRWEWSLLFVVLVCLVAAGIIFRKVRQSEVGA